MRAAIIDDRAEDRAILHRELDTILRERGYSVEGIDLFSGGEEFLAKFRGGRYDLVFLDIYMEGINGIQTAREIRRKAMNSARTTTCSNPLSTPISSRHWP